MEDLILTNGKILTPFKELNDSVLFLKDGKIEKIIKYTEFKSNKEFYDEKYKIIDINNNYISPGFIDIHTHGANNVDAAKGPYEAMTEFIVKYGTTGFLPTFWNANISVFNENIDIKLTIINGLIEYNSSIFP